MPEEECSDVTERKCETRTECDDVTDQQCLAFSSQEGKDMPLQRCHYQDSCQSASCIHTSIFNILIQHDHNYNEVMII